MVDFSDRHDQYGNLSAYEREHLGSRSKSTVLAEAAEDDPDVCKEYCMILKEPGMGYNFEVEDFKNFPRPVWEWEVN